MSTIQYWIMKSEPDTYSIDHLKRDTKTPWSGVRNFQARNYMRDSMRVGDVVLFYHSSCKVPGIYGLGKVVSKAYADPTQFDTKSPYFEPRATHEKPLWFLVDVAYTKTLNEPITLSYLKAQKALQTMKVLEPGSRLSVTPVTPHEYSLLAPLI